MNERSETPERPASQRMRFSLGSLLLWTAIVGLATAYIMNSRKLSRLQSELDAHRPIPVAEVATQFEKATTIPPITVTVKDVRYSSTKDSYKIDFSWTDRTTNKSWFSDIHLKSDGYGAYYGTIRNGPFVQPLGYKNGFTVAVNSKSSLQE